LDGLKIPLELRGFRNRYSSERSRDFNSLSVRHRVVRDGHRKLLAQLLRNARTEAIHGDDLDLALIRLRQFRQHVVIHLRSFYRREMPAAVFGANIRRNCSLNLVPDAECATLYRYRSRADLRRVFICLRLPARCGPFDNGRYLPSEACFLYTSRRMAHVGRTKELRQYFGGEKTMWSRAYRYSTFTLH